MTVQERTKTTKPSRAQPPVRLLLAKPGLDGHDRGVKALAYALRDAGMEVVYTGLHRTVEEIVKIALEEDVDVIGLSILSGAHLHHSQRLIELVTQRGLDNVLIMIGGLIPDKDIPTLKAMGVHGVFSSYSRFEDIRDFIEKNVRARKGSA